MPPAKQISSSGLSFLKHYEGLGHNVQDGKYFPYNDGAGVLTIGYGHVIKPYEVDAYLGGMSLSRAKILLKTDKLKFLQSTMGLTETQASDLFVADMRTYVGIVNAAARFVLTDSQFDALVSLVYNGGSKPLLQSSTLGRNLAQNQPLMAGLQFPHWNKAKNEKTGKFGPWAGLTFRRYSELLMFLTGEVQFAHTFSGAQGLIDKITAFYKGQGVECHLPYADGLASSMVG